MANATGRCQQKRGLSCGNEERASRRNRYHQYKSLKELDQWFEYELPKNLQG